MARTSLPPGFRFHPTDVELVMYYLKRKVMGKKLHFEAIAEVNIYKFSPWDLPDFSCLKSKDLEWFFFCPREKKYASGARVKRATENGFWKTTGKDRFIHYNEKIVGSVKTLVFHLGHAPKGERTDWVIHEYRMVDEQLSQAGLQDAYVLCKVFQKSGPGPRNGAQYGAPFNEADWADDAIDDAENCVMPLASDVPPPTTLMQQEQQICHLLTGPSAPENTSMLNSAENCGSLSACRPTSEVLVGANDDEINCLLANFIDENTMVLSEDGVSQDDLFGENGLPCSDGYDIFDNLGALDAWAQMNGCRVDNLSGMQEDVHSLNNMLLQDNTSYIELNDLLDPLNFSAGVSDTNNSSVVQTFGSFNPNILQLYSGASFAGMDHHTRVNRLPDMPEGFYEEDDCLHVLEVNNQFYQDATHYLDLPFGQPDIGANLNRDKERGPRKIICFPRLLESIPARTPQLALSYSPYCSSIHIKAEVTHGAGECTKDALTVMMGGSSSCWCFILHWTVLLQEMWLWVDYYLLYLVKFVFDVVLVYDYCYLNGTLLRGDLIRTVVIQMKILPLSSFRQSAS